MEEPIRGQKDDDGRHSHQRGGDACSRILYSHQREADTHEGTEDGGGSSNGKSFPVVHSLA